MTVPEPREPAPTPVTSGPRGHLRGHHIFWSLIAGLIIVAVAITAGWVIARPYGQDEWADVIRSAVLAAGAVAAVPAGYVAYRKQQTTEAERHEAIDKEQRRRDELIEANTRADAKDYRDRYAAASGQLGSEKAAIRLAGVYALAQLADEWGRTEPDQRQVCIDVLCAYLRMPWPTPLAVPPTRPTRSTGRRLAGHPPAPPPPRPPTDHREASEETQVRATILRVAADHLHRDRNPETAWWRNDFDLRGAERLPECQFVMARLSGTFDARGATISGHAGFLGATFSGKFDARGATFSEDAEFEGATFSEDTGFEGATFSGHAGFLGATFSRNAWFVSATFSGNAWFASATFSGHAEFGGATFSGNAEFGGATFSGNAWFRGATFSEDAGFGGATFSKYAWFKDATFAGNAEVGARRSPGTPSSRARRSPGTPSSEVQRSPGMPGSKARRSPKTRGSGRQWPSERSPALMARTIPQHPHLVRSSNPCSLRPDRKKVNGLPRAVAPVPLGVPQVGHPDSGSAIGLGEGWLWVGQSQIPDPQGCPGEGPVSGQRIARGSDTTRCWP